MRRVLLSCLLLGALPLRGGEPVDYAPEVRELSEFVRKEMERTGIPCASVAIVDGGRVVWEAGFGFQDSARRVPATGKTAYRVGSISKVFTAILVLQLAERGALDLDAPIARYAPELVFEDASGASPPITLRELLSHRAGIARESPVGSYFDDSEPGIERTVRSFIGTRLVHRPGERTKYSNVGPTIAGYIVEKVTAKPFSKLAREALLDPLGMDASSFEADREAIRRDLADAFMVDFEGKFFPAPKFSLGTVPAGNLYSTASDLARFLVALFAGGEIDGRRVLRRETLESMLRVQPPGTSAPTGFGLGFYVGRWEGRRTVGHNGAVYGFASALLALPEERLGAVVLNSVDCANGFDDKVARKALALLLEKKLGVRVPAPPEPIALERARLEEVCGLYAAPGREALVALAPGGLRAEILGAPHELVPIGADRFLSDGRLSYGTVVRFLRDGGGRVRALEAGGVEHARVESPPDAELPPEQARFLGEYGWPHNVLAIRARRGRLSARIEWFFEYPLEPEGGLSFRFPDYGLYEGERLEFVEGEGGRVVAARVGPVEFPRR